jgi:hypothetical protein
MITEERLKEIANAQPVQEYDTAYITLGDIKEIAQELIEARQLAQNMRCLRNLMGYVENGSEQTVALFQDAATMDFFVKTRVHRKENTYWGHSLREAIQKAFEAEGDRT